MICLKCGAINELDDHICKNCGETFDLSDEQKNKLHRLAINRSAEYENFKGFNFGAFSITWLWAFSHKLWLVALIALLLAIPPVLYMSFIWVVLISIPFKICIGNNANKMAWKSCSFKTINDFNKSQRNWSILGAIICCLWVVYIAFFVPTGFLRSRDQANFTSCLDTLQAVKVAEEMYIVDNNVYTDNLKHLTEYMIADCADPMGISAGCVDEKGKNLVEARVENNCASPLKIEVKKDSFTIKAISKDKNTCHICVGSTGFLPEKFMECPTRKSSYDSKCSDL